MKTKMRLCSLGLLTLMGFLLYYSGETAQAMRQGLRLCGTTVIPALFPFLVLSRILTAILPKAVPNFLHRLMSRFFGVSGACFFPLVISFLGGYPVGVSSVAALYEQGCIPKSEAENALRFCNNSGPGIFAGFLGAAVFASPLAGLVLYLIHVATALLIGMLLAKPNSSMKLHGIPQETAAFSTVFLHAVRDSCEAMLQICGLILIFSLLPMFLRLLSVPAVLQTFLGGFTELTGGLLALERDSLSFVLAAFFTGWGGLCVQMQAYSIWHRAGLQPKGCFLEKLLHGLFSAFFAQLFLYPTAVSRCIALLLVAVCIFSPYFRQKYGGNLRQYRI